MGANFHQNSQAMTFKEPTW